MSLVCRQVRDSVQWIYSEPMLVYYIQLFRDGYWPNGQLSAAAEAPTDCEKLNMRRNAKSALLRNIPGTYMLSDVQSSPIKSNPLSFCRKCIKIKYILYFVIILSSIYFADKFAVEF